MSLTCVYFIQAQPSGLIKIGVSGFPGERVRQIQRTHAGMLTLLSYMPAPADAERAAHRRFAADRVTGEWFNPTAAILALSRIRDPLAFLRAVYGDEVEASSRVARAMAADIEEDARLVAQRHARGSVSTYLTRDAFAYWGEWASLLGAPR